MRVATLYSGISAGTELAFYRGTNPYLEKQWDPEAALFLPGDSTLHYPVTDWGYSEVGEIEALGPDVTELILARWSGACGVTAHMPYCRPRGFAATPFRTDWIRWSAPSPESAPSH